LALLRVRPSNDFDMSSMHPEVSPALAIDEAPNAAGQFQIAGRRHAVVYGRDEATSSGPLAPVTLATHGAQEVVEQQFLAERGRAPLPGELFDYSPGRPLRDANGRRHAIRFGAFVGDDVETRADAGHDESPRAMPNLAIMTLAQATVAQEDTVCAVCLGEGHADAPGAWCKLPCGHAFHRPCLQEMALFPARHRCPLCRADLDVLTREGNAEL